MQVQVVIRHEEPGQSISNRFKTREREDLFNAVACPLVAANNKISCPKINYLNCFYSVIKQPGSFFSSAAVESIWRS
jgi:hypothetical protein